MERWKNTLGTFAGIIRDGDTTRSDIAVLWCVWHVAEGDTCREGIAELEICCHFDCLMCEIRVELNELLCRKLGR